MTTWRQTTRNDGPPVPTTDVLLSVLSLETVVPITSLIFSIRTDGRFNMNLVVADGRTWNEIVDVVPSDYTVDPGAITGAWRSTEQAARNAVRDELVSLAKNKATTLVEFVKEIP